MINKTEKNSILKIVLLALAINILVFVAKGSLEYFNHSNAVKNGKLSKTVFTIDDCTVNSMKQLADGSWRTTDNDPQLIIEYNGMMDGISLEMESQLYTGEIVVYYTKAEGQDFSLKNRLILVPDKDNENLYISAVSLDHIAKIRIDPTSVGGNLLQIGEITINPDKEISDYLSITAYDVLILMLYTAITAAILAFIQEIFTKKSQ